MMPPPGPPHGVMPPSPMRHQLQPQPNMPPQHQMSMGQMMPQPPPQQPPYPQDNLHALQRVRTAFLIHVLYISFCKPQKENSLIVELLDRH